MVSITENTYDTSTALHCNDHCADHVRQCASVDYRGRKQPFHSCRRSHSRQFSLRLQLCSAKADTTATSAKIIYPKTISVNKIAA
jgi:hypothetical protein